MVRAISIVLLSLITSFLMQAQMVHPIGGYIESQCTNCATKQSYERPIYDLSAIVYFENTSKIPDSIQFSLDFRNSKIGSSAKLSETLLCDGTRKVVYNKMSQLFSEGSTILFSSFPQYKVSYKGKNLPDSIQFTLQHEIIVNRDFNSPQNTSCSFLDYGILTVEKGINSSVNFNSKPGSAILSGFDIPNWPWNTVYIEPGTGTLFAPNSLDTGYHTVAFGVTEIGSKGEKFDISYFVGTIRVVNDFIFFKNNGNDIPAVPINQNDTVVSFNIEFLNQSKLKKNDFSFDWTSPIKFDIPPNISVLNTADSIFDIKVTIHLNSKSQSIYNSLPTSFNLIAHYPDTFGKCKTLMNSVILKENNLQGINSILESNSINLFPNPVIDKLIITNAPNCNITIYDMFGRQLITTYDKEIEMGHFNSGLYIVVLTNQNGEEIKTTKIIKN